jgi:hypothetical protein
MSFHDRFVLHVFGAHPAQAASTIQLIRRRGRVIRCMAAVGHRDVACNVSTMSGHRHSATTPCATRTGRQWAVGGGR